MIRSNRRTFMLQVAGTAAALATVHVGANAQAPMVDPKDPLAARLGYVDDTTKADAKKYPQHKNEQRCSNCTLYTGKAGDKSGPCSIFAGKQVAADGWCVSWVKKA